ncbi:hypothetical protein ACIQU4_07965 [Streptomyces sp. NPDC090741]|uniref:hypothetical protein n=1 Tax=Streptomyces sp. NPDC090741 TaxID=3365967 RepID=UPI0038305FC1
MAEISIPIEDLKNTLAMLADIRSRIENRTGLEKVGTGSDVGDSTLVDAIQSFDSAWQGGHERVQENVDTFRDAAQGIVDNFQGTDEELGNALNH